MLVHKLVCVVLVASTIGRSEGVPQYILGQWITDDNRQCEGCDRQYLEIEETAYPSGPPVMSELQKMEDQHFLTSPSVPFLMTEQDSPGEEQAVWKVFLIVAILLLSATGTLAVTCYLCFWDVHKSKYQPLRELSALI